jgi:RNA polymerase sigma-70 factor (ECF subfamily)
MSSIPETLNRESVLSARTGDDIVTSGAVRALRTDAQLIDLILSGDQYAFEELFDRHKRHVARVAARYFHRPDQIEEVIQVAFAKAFLELGKFRGEHSFSFPSWIGRIAANACLDQIRTHKRKPEDLHCELSEGETQTVLDLAEDSGASPEQALVNRDLANKLLEKLDIEDRALLHMIYVDEMSVAEVGEFFGWSKSKVKIRAWRARNSLKKTLRKYL